MCKKRYVITATAFDRKGNVISRKTNDYQRSHPYQKALSLRAGMHEGRCYLHAEVAALLDAARQRKKVSTLFVERYDNNGRPKLAFPCPSCVEGIFMAGVKKVIYTTEEGQNSWEVGDENIKW